MIRLRAGVADGVRIKQYRRAVFLQIVHGDLKRRIGRMHGRIQRSIFAARHCEVECRIIVNAIPARLSRTDDEVNGAVFFIDLSARHRLGTGIRMVVPGEYGIKAHFVHKRRDHFVRRIAAAGNIGKVRRPVQREYFPNSVAVGGVFPDPIHRLVQPVCRINIDDRNIHVAVRHGIIIFTGNKVHRCGICAIAALVFMVAEYLHKVDIRKRREQVEDIAPQGVVAAVIDEVTCLQGKIVIDAAVDDRIAICNRGIESALLFTLGLLRIADDKEVRIGAEYRGREVFELRPRYTVACHIHIFGTFCKPCDQHLIDIDGIGVGEIHEQGLAFYRSERRLDVCLVVCLRRILDNGLLFCCKRIGKPYDALFCVAVRRGNGAHI